MALVARPSVVDWTQDMNRISEFWSFYSGEMDTVDDKSACAVFAARLKTEDGAIFVGCMKELSLLRMQTLLAGRRAWLKSIQKLIGHVFTNNDSNVPASAPLAFSSSQASPLEDVDDKPVRPVERFVPNFKLGEKLTREKRMHEIRLPFDHMEAAFQTSAPGENELTPGDTRIVSAEAFDYMAIEWDYVSGDKLLFDHMASETAKRFPRPHGKFKGRKGWSKIYANRFKHGRAPSKKVRHRSSSLRRLTASHLDRIPAVRAENMLPEAHDRPHRHPRWIHGPRNLVRGPRGVRGYRG